MSGSFFDFDGDGDTDFLDVAIGASIIGSYGYGAGLSAAEEINYQVEDEYKAELKRKNKRIKELEDELDVLRNTSDGFDDVLYDVDYDDYDDYDDYEDDDDGDFERYPDTIATSNAQDLAAALKLSSCLLDGSSTGDMSEGDCTHCVFWDPGETHDTRGYCCQIWYWVQINYGGAIQDTNPHKDNKVCPKFQEGTGIPVNCYDCKHWNQDKLIENRFLCCKNWDAVSKTIEDIRELLRKRIGPNIDFGAFNSHYAYGDELVCFDFERDENLAPGYGKERIKEAKTRAGILKKISPLLLDGTYVAGLNYNDNAKTWLAAQKDAVVTLEREPANRHDSHAIKILVNEKMAGYIPAKISSALSLILDDGGMAQVQKFQVITTENDKTSGGEKVSVRIFLNVADKDGTIMTTLGGAW